MERHYGLDWLRIGAFGLLILYHVGMVFVPWDYHVKTANPPDWVAIPMLATNSWRLLLLFVVSGYATRALAGKAGSLVASRSKRLLIPLFFGAAVIVPPQAWVELVTQHDYPHSLGWFWVHDYFGLHTVDGIILPTWNHLWFVAYLWVYTMLLAGARFVLRETSLQELFDTVFGMPGVFLVPVAWLLFASLYLAQGGQETHDLVFDYVAHLQYLPGFLFGFGLGKSGPAMRAIQRLWVPAACLAIPSYVIVAVIEYHWPGSSMPQPYGYIFAVARILQGWSVIVALIGIASRFWNRDSAARRTLTEAIFPFYLIHQTIIVGGEYLLLPYKLHPASEFLALVAATVAGCAAFYFIGREIGPLRPLIGLRSHPKPGKEAVL